MITTEKPTLQEFHIEGVKHITPSGFRRLIDVLCYNHFMPSAFTSFPKPLFFRLEHSVNK